MTAQKRPIRALAMRNPIEFGIYCEQQNRSWPQLVEIWLAAEEAGFDTAWLFDHFIPEEADESGSCFEAWSLLAALATQTTRIRIGVLVSSNTHRHPAVLAKQAVTVDHVSEGRLNLGIGTGWRELEHSAYGIPLPTARERVDRLGEALELMRRLEIDDRPSFDGRYYRLDNAPFAPKPVQAHIPVVVAAIGPRMLRHVARYADQWDTWGGPEVIAANGVVVDALAREMGRDPLAIRRSICTGEAPLSSHDVLAAHVANYAAAGVSTFIFNVAFDRPVELIRRVAPWMNELRDAYGDVSAAPGARGSVRTRWSGAHLP
jgi:alkanesulfonate monooxygenase SsuD/methylene tetrahydromethanopterin reductase-like flavin-dependent oxidoreductase (luciferase family)